MRGTETSSQIAELKQRPNYELPTEDGWELLGIARSLHDQPEAAAEAFAQALPQAKTDAERKRIRNAIAHDPLFEALLNENHSSE